MADTNGIKKWLKKEFMPVKSKGSRNRVLSLDFLKILAAFLVVFYHLAYSKLDYGFTEGQLYWPNLNRIAMCFASCSVPVFFLVNGVLMMGRERSWKSVYLKALNIAVLMVLWSVAQFPSWFFRTLALTYLMHPLLQYLLKKKMPLYLLLCGAVFVMPFLYNAMVLVIKAMGIQAIGPVPVGGLQVTGVFTMYGLLYFMMGPLLERKEKYPVWLGILCAVSGWALVITECVIYTNLDQAVYDGVNHAFPTIGALLLSVGVYMLVKRLDLRRLEKPIAFLCDGILPVYVMHIGVILLIKRLTGPFTLNLATAILGTCGVCLICTLLGKLLQRIPVLCRLVRM